MNQTLRDEDTQRKSGGGDPPPVVDSTSAKAGEGATNRPLIAYSLPRANHVPIVPAPTARTWMLNTPKQFANRCLPLLIANQAGWFLLNMQSFRATWNGGNERSSTSVEFLEGTPSRPGVASHFGNGILTWFVGYLFRTPPGYNLLVQGPSNMPKDGISALQGVVETDWAVANFTMNWKFTRPNHPVTFEAGEPFCMVVPQRRHELEEFAPRIVPITEEAELASQWEEFDRRRSLMLGLRRLVSHRANERSTTASRVPYERHYFEGTSPGGASAPEHQKKLRLKKFKVDAEPADVDDGG
jgi:hypothetical protein